MVGTIVSMETAWSRKILLERALFFFQILFLCFKHITSEVGGQTRSELTQVKFWDIVFLFDQGFKCSL